MRSSFSSCRWLAISLTACLLVVSGCGDKAESEDDCVVDAYQCSDEEILQQCDAEEGWVDAEDCAAQGLMCHAEMGHCMAGE